GSQKAASIGIQTTQRSNWYSKQGEQKIIYQQKQIDTDRFQITPAHQIPKMKTPPWVIPISQASLAAIGLLRSPSPASQLPQVPRKA
ncbi:hypothetical protein N7645_24125, partial [Pseudomonas juntendi]|uniref:hypothetical protein n=1 Tax=Pseudomonas TaxID=286 RepID=UPI001C44AEA0